MLTNPSYLELHMGSSLLFQWSRHNTSVSGGTGLIPGFGELKIPHAHGAAEDKDCMGPSWHRNQYFVLSAFIFPPP